MTSIITELPVDQAAREHALNIARSIIVQAPAGSGKTELLTTRFLRLLAVVDEPEQVLAITFTRSATAEMRQRILEKLEAAKRAAHPADDLAIEFARAALAQSEKRGWQLLDQPQRLNIQTIDSLCMAIAHQTPLLARLGGALQPTEQAEPLYLLAAQRTLERLGGNNISLNDALRELLLTRDNNLEDCKSLLADMLKKREQWAHAFLLSGEVDWDEVRNRLEQPFQREIRRVLKKAHELFSRDPAMVSELQELVNYACTSSDLNKTLIRQLVGATSLPSTESPERWKCIAEFLLTKEGKWLKAVDKNDGFPRGPKNSQEARQKGRMIAVLEHLAGDDDLLETLRDIRKLPPPRYADEQWWLLRHLFTVLRYSVAELKVVFAERNAVDFAELSMAAHAVLRAQEGAFSEPSEAGLRLSDSVRHLLVDEFQDTSRQQYEFISMLVRGWDSDDGRTCFLVGDPMQSIYLFRQAEVELFEQVRRAGLNAPEQALHLDAIQLAANFRSSPGVVAQVNRHFPLIFESGRPTGSGSVTYAPSVARDGSSSRDAWKVHANFISIAPGPDPARSSSGSTNPRKRIPQSKAEAADRETKQIVAIIREHLPAIESASARPEGRFTVAVLARVKKHLHNIAAALHAEGIPFRAVELESLTERQEVLDLKSLVRALTHPWDRIAWLTMLRAPWCGLELKDIHLLCGTDRKDDQRLSVLQQIESNLEKLSAEAQRRVMRVAAVLQEALRVRYRQASFVSWIERSWHSLGGPECLDAAEYENAMMFFRMLEQVTLDGIEATSLDEQLARLFAQPDPDTSERCGLQLMTIHKAKGLGFDVVIVPGLEQPSRKDSQALICYQERTVDTIFELLVAPIGERGVMGQPLYKWVQSQRSKRQAEERKRLLYVACTRARESVHLFGTAMVTDRTMTAEKADSLLRTAWPAFSEIFESAWQRTLKSQKPQVLATESKLASFPQHGTQPGVVDLAAAGDLLPFPKPVSSEPLKLRRLPLDWKHSPVLNNVTVASTNRTSGQPSRRLFDRPEASRETRLLGTTVHALFEQIAGMLKSVSVEEIVEIAMPRLRAYAEALLRNGGIAPAAVQSCSATAMQAVQSALADTHGLWILGPHREAQTESSWTGGTSGGLGTLRVDRIFKSGEAPLSDDGEYLWIVDYKTAQHSEGSLDEFLEGERAIYSEQIEAYGEMMRLAHGNFTGLRLALYYPLIKRLCWWAA